MNVQEKIHRCIAMGKKRMLLLSRIKKSTLWKNREVAVMPFEKPCLA
ncbi:MAG: hypothetical protein K0Q56_1110 [Sporolactobacillus laevolacticus]|jgi:hypothetical protein|nr:hypothetical protein [Sporolactobacillus laevolacticus]